MEYVFITRGIREEKRSRSSSLDYGMNPLPVGSPNLLDARRIQPKPFQKTLMPRWMT
jgi:hypothetical protein